MSGLGRLLVAVGMIASFAVGLAAGRLTGFAERPAPREQKEIREGSGGYINPLLECEVATERLYVALRPFNTQLVELIKALELDRRASTIAVYFRDLNNGSWVGHRERRRYVPASLAKLPVVIACYRQAEIDPDFLSRRILYEGLEEERLPGFVNPESNMLRGNYYTVDELILRIAKYSDNAAANLLVKALPAGLLQSVYFDLGVDSISLKNRENALSPKEYSAFFRVLYNASYLSKGFSERALRYLDQSTFELGLVAGVPEGVPVSHKFGVWEDKTPGVRSPFQLHDCGIVYHPQRPYLLCVMTAGDNYVNMAAAIASISRFTYRQVNSSLIRPGDWKALADGEMSDGEP